MSTGECRQCRARVRGRAASKNPEADGMVAFQRLARSRLQRLHDGVTASGSRLQRLQGVTAGGSRLQRLQGVRTDGDRPRIRASKAGEGGWNRGNQGKVLGGTHECPGGTRSVLTRYSRSTVRGGGAHTLALFEKTAAVSASTSACAIDPSGPVEKGA
jgi:hypothetical protein